MKWNWNLRRQRVWGCHPQAPMVIEQSGIDPHIVCVCVRVEDVEIILKLLPLMGRDEDRLEAESRRIDILERQRNALLNAIEIAGFRLKQGLTLQIVADDGGPDGRNFQILNNISVQSPETKQEPDTGAQGGK